MCKVNPDSYGFNPIEGWKNKVLRSRSIFPSRVMPRHGSDVRGVAPQTFVDWRCLHSPMGWIRAGMTGMDGFLACWNRPKIERKTWKYEGNIIELPYPGWQLFDMLFGVTFLKCWISTILQTNTSMNRSNTKTVPIFDKKHTHNWLFINGGLLICTHTIPYQYSYLVGEWFVRYLSLWWHFHGWSWEAVTRIFETKGVNPELLALDIIG